MKKIVALVLLAIMMLGTLVMGGCSKKDLDDKGAIIQMYLSDFPTNLDPTAVTYGSADNIKFFGLLYEGLYKINDEGELKEVLADEHEYYVDPLDNHLKLEITLGKSRWSDGVPVDADDFIYAWQRLLLPETDNPSASLLYPIKNAKAVKEGLCSLNDLGVYAIKDNVIQITFEKDFTNIEYFMRRLASPVLVPLREDNATKFDDETNLDYIWDASATVGLPVTNGPFKYKKINTDKVELERNIHYKDVSAVEDNPVDKVVKPYQLVTLYNVKNENKKIVTPVERFKSGDIFYINLSNADADEIKQAGKGVKQEAIPSTYTYFFDTTNELFADARVRKALSIALDREYISELTGRKVKVAEGIVPFGVENTTEDTDFRKEGGNLYDYKTSKIDKLCVGDLETAKALLKEAGVNKATVTIEFNGDREYEKEIAEYAKKVWKELGITVRVSSKNSKFVNILATGSSSLTGGDARIVGMDLQCITPDAYGLLMSFSSKYSGKPVDVTTDELVYTPGITGFDDKEYDAICDEIVSALNNKARAEAMHKAEEYLVEKSPVIPLFCNVDVYASKKLDNISSDSFGRKNFTKLEQENYKKYLPEETVIVPDSVDGEDAE